MIKVGSVDQLRLQNEVSALEMLRVVPNTPKISKVS